MTLHQLENTILLVIKSKDSKYWARSFFFRTNGLNSVSDLYSSSLAELTRDARAGGRSPNEITRFSNVIYLITFEKAGTTLLQS